MLKKRVIPLIGLIILGLIGAISCMSGVESQSDPSGETPAAATLSSQALSQTENGNEDYVVDATPASESSLDGESETQMEPGAGDSAVENSAESVGDSAGQIQGDSMQLYSDSVYLFQISYPSSFVFSIQSAEQLEQLAPKPLTGFRIVNPTLAASDLGDLEPADLEIRIYEVGDHSSLESWLDSAGLLSTSQVKPFQTDFVSGSELCSTLLVGPGCSYFVMGGSFVYQMTPASLDGETIIRTFMMVPSG